MAENALTAALEKLNLSQSAFTRRLQELGDPRTFPTILRSVSNQCRGATSVSGEMMVIITLLLAQAKPDADVQEAA